MRISTKGRYALRLMLDLAVNGKDNYISIKNISTRQEISDKYLEQIINQLCKKCQRGKRRLPSFKRTERLHRRYDFKRNGGYSFSCSLLRL